MSLYNQSVFFISLINARIFYTIYDTRVEDLYTAQDYLISDVFIESDSFLGKSDRLGNFFLSSLALNSYIQVTCARMACFAKNTCVKSSSIKGASTEDTGTKSIGTKGIYAKDTCTGLISVTDTKAACIQGTLNDVVKHLGIYLQSSQIFEVRLFNILFQTGVRAS